MPNKKKKDPKLKEGVVDIRISKYEKKILEKGYTPKC